MCWQHIQRISLQIPAHKGPCRQSSHQESRACQLHAAHLTLHCVFHNAGEGPVLHLPSLQFVVGSSRKEHLLIVDSCLLETRNNAGVGLVCRHAALLHHHVDTGTLLPLHAKEEAVRGRVKRPHTGHLPLHRECSKLLQTWQLIEHGPLLGHQKHLAASVDHR